MKKLFITFIAAVLFIASGMAIQADTTTTKIFKNLTVTASQGSIKVGDEFTYNVDGFEFNTVQTPDLVGQHSGALMFEFFSESTDSSIELQSIDFPKTTFVTDDGETFGALYTIMNFEQTDGFDVTTWLSDPAYKTANRNQFKSITENFTKNGFRVYVRPTREGSDYGIYDKTYKAMEMDGPIRFNYKVVDNGQSFKGRPNPYFAFMASSPETGLPKETAFGYTYFADYSLKREIVEPYNNETRSLSIKYTIKNTGSYPVTKINLYEIVEGFKPQGQNWIDTSDPIYIKQILQDNNYQILNPGDEIEFVEKFILEESYNKSDYTFKGGLYTNNDFERRTSSENLTVNFEVQKYRINFQTNGGTQINPYLNVERGALLKIPTSVKEGYKFIGWYKDELLTELWNFSEDRVSGDMTLFAKWNKQSIEEKYDVTFNSNGGTSVERQFQIGLGSKVVKPLDPSKEGYKFDGWFQDSELSKPWNFDTDLVTDNITLNAKWNKINVEDNKYNVTFESNGGSHVDPQLGIKEGSLVKKPFDPQYDGFQFDGWYRDEDFKKIWNFDTETVEENMTLYAKWTEVKPAIEKTNPVLPSTGVNNNYIGISILLVGVSIIVVMSKKKRKEIY
ncbi:MAG: InlB B-repeat-containing protein [Erysipelothrix sp.]